ncbi:CusA/CzcA family heavy metal efflux RND transporter [Aquimarina sp. W85]|uniref:CusA/CzcA family heavy metal efflux RND transporter n=1 Tax=Aquimarina rhodophyticola TaxID=3342246 RepID=UPI00366B20C8
MINRIIDFSIQNKLIIGVFTCMLIGAGVWSITQVPIDAVPDITNNQVQVITQSPNLGTEDIEQFVTYPVEVAMSNVPNVKEIRSISRFGLSVVTIVFDDKVGTYLPRQLVAAKLSEVQEQIPEGFGKPTMGPISSGLGEIYQYTLTVDQAYQKDYDITALRTMQDWIIKRQMAMVPGVIEVNAFGGYKRQYEVAINPAELQAIGVTLSEVFKALKNNNQNTGGAYIEKKHQANFIRGEGLARTVSDIERMVIKTVNTIPIRIKDVGKVTIGSAIRYGALTKDGQGEAVGGMILMLKGANSDAVITEVKARMRQIQKSLPTGVIIEPFLDRSELIEKTTTTVFSNLLEGGLIVIFVLVLLLGNWRAGLIVASTIPLSILFAFILMNVFDVWANLMSLGAIDFGIIVDGAVIIVESTVFMIYQYSVKNKVDKLTSKEKNSIAAKASKKMMNTAFFGQLIILIVFLPILALEGVEGKMFRPMALTFIFAMIGAMLLCLTYVPMVTSLLITKVTASKTSYGDRLIHWIALKYEYLVVKSLKKGAVIIGIAILLLGVALFTYSRMGGEFIPELDEGDIAFHAMLKPGSSLQESIATTTKIEQRIKAKFPEVKTVVSRIGVADVPTDPMPMDIADVFAILTPRATWTSAKTKEELVHKIKEELSVLPGVNFEFTQPIEMRFNELLTGVREDVAIKLFGEDLDVLSSKAQEMGKIISKVPGVADFKVEATDGLPQITVRYDRDKLSQYGLTITNINTTIQTAFAGNKAGVIFEGEKRFDLVVRFQETYRATIQDLHKLFITLPNGSQLPLRELASIRYEPGPMQISRDNTNRRTYVGINIRGRDVQSVVKDIKQRLDQNFKLPAGYFIRYGGAFENLERASNRLQTVVPIALLLIFILIYFALKSFAQTLMIYVAIPMATIGGVFALWLRDMPFSISAGVGFIVLFGVAVLNGLVMISGLNELKEEGVTTIKDRIIQGTKRRIRPIVLTALTDILGFLPMAISLSAGAEVQRPLATVVIGGLVTSTLLTLFVLPICYQWIEKRADRRVLSKPMVVSLFLGGLFFYTASAEAQVVPKQYPEISLEASIALAKQNYPLLKIRQLELDKQDAQRGVVYDFGTTRIFTAGEEINADRGIYTLIGVGQSNIDLFGMRAKKRLLQKQSLLAHAFYEQSELEIAQEVKSLWTAVYLDKQTHRLYKELDSIYSNFSKAVALQYKVEMISRLEFEAAQNQVAQIQNKVAQLTADYAIALEQLNLWLGDTTYYTVSDTIAPAAFEQLESVGTKLHPELKIMRERLELSKATYKAVRSQRLPKLTLQGGLQEINGVSDFYSYQLGVSLPLLDGKSRAQVRTSKLDASIAQESSTFAQKQFESRKRQAFQNFEKWQNTHIFYSTKAVPLAQAQRKGALIGYKEGALDYTAFTLLIKEAIQTEEQALQVLKEYLEARFALHYFKQYDDEK